MRFVISVLLFSNGAIYMMGFYPMSKSNPTCASPYWCRRSYQNLRRRRGERSQDVTPQGVFAKRPDSSTSGDVVPACVIVPVSPFWMKHVSSLPGRIPGETETVTLTSTIGA